MTIFTNYSISELNTVIDQALSGITFADHTFLMRKAPKASVCFGDGNVYAEVRCAGNLSAMSVLRILEIPYTVVETWQHPIKGWKLLRFTVTNPSDLLRIHESCGAPDIENRDIETQDWLAAIAVEKLTRNDLVTLAKLAKIPGRSRMTKPELAIALGLPVLPVAA